MWAVFWTKAGRSIRSRWRRILEVDQARSAGVPQVRRAQRMAPDAEGHVSPRVVIRRCSDDGLTFADDPRFGRCDQCGLPTERLTVDVATLEDGRAPTVEESLDLRRQIMEEKAFAARVADAQRIAQEREQEGRIRAATAALRYDLDRWLEADPAEWGPTAELGG